MQNIEEQALSTYTKTLPLWLRYVDDTFTAVHKDEIDTFHEHLNRFSVNVCCNFRQIRGEPLQVVGHTEETFHFLLAGRGWHFLYALDLGRISF